MLVQQVRYQLFMQISLAMSSGAAMLLGSLPLLWSIPYGIGYFVLKLLLGCGGRMGMLPKYLATGISVHWSEQGLELDLFLLQCCAALAPADLYVKRIVERFGLLDYLSLSLERSNEYEPVPVQEMLTLIMQILQERRFCGRNTADSLKRELIYKLAIGDATHSQLVKSLPWDLSKFDQLQEILDRVAVYSNPSGLNQGTYSLRWAYWKELDLYHPRWNSRDLQVAEERYLRFCGVSAMTTQLPRWTKIYPPLEGVARIATCRVTLQIIRAVLFYSVFADKFTESCAPDGILMTALHLLSLALDIYLQQHGSSGVECHIGDSNSMPAFAAEEITESLNYAAGKQSLLSLLVALMRMRRQENQNSYLESSNCSFSPLIESLLKKFAEVDSQCMTKLQQLAPEVVGHLSKSTPNTDRSTSGSASDSEMRKAKARKRQDAILAKMKAEQSKFLSSIPSTAVDYSKSEAETSNSDTEHEAEGAVQQSCSLCHDATSKNPVSFLILLQKSRLLSFVDRGSPSWDRWSDKEQGSIPTNRVTDQSGSNASSSSSGLASQLVQLTENPVVESAIMGKGKAVNTVYNLETLEEDMYISIRKEICDTLLSSSFKKDEVSSTTESSPQSSRKAEPDILGKYIVALSSETSENSLGTENTDGDIELTESTSQPLVYDGFGLLDCDGIYISSCGHAVHQSCLDCYLSSQKERYVQRSFFEGAHIVDPDQGEFLCPVCRRLANSVLPAVNGSPSAPNEEICSLLFQQGLSLLKTAAKVVGRPDFFEALSLKRKEKTSQNLEPISHVLSKMYFSKKQDPFLGSPRLSHPIILWDTLKYSLMSTEIAARSGKTSMATNYTLTSLYEELKSSSEFIFSLLLRVVQNLSSTNSLHALQRFRGLQLFAESICSGVSFDSHSTRHKQEGSDCARWYFVSNDVDHSCDIKNMIRRFSFPYLRRCALLWKLLKSSIPAPFCDRDNVWESSHVMTDMMDTTKIPFKLMSLPPVYQDLLQRYIKQCCPNCKAVLDEPVLCLLCGRLCSSSCKPCCRESGCIAHAMTCGAGIGVFLLIRRTTILLQRCARQAPWLPWPPWPSPYLDAFGEEDIEMHRGKPLYLNEERYAALTYMVASHGLDRSSKVLDQTTIGTFFMV
ncbi:hypothetical protein CRYUN_Cryun09bG0020100 [Craigia yunnanensis]